MIETRRHMLTAFLGAAVVLPMKPLLAWPQALGTGHTVKPHPYPNGRDPSAPVNLDDLSAVNPKAMEMEKQKEIRANVAKLYEMVSELKDQIDKTDPTATLSVTFVKKAQQIEKLAKQIKDRAKG